MLGLRGGEGRPWASHFSPASLTTSKYPKGMGPQRLAPSWAEYPLSLPRGPQPQGPLRRRWCWEQGPQPPPPCPTPTQSPLSPAQGPTQAHCCPFMGTGHPGGGLCQGVHPPTWASSRVGPLTPFLPGRCQSVWQGQTGSFMQTFRTSPLSREKEGLSFGTKQVKTVSFCISAWGGGLHPISTYGNLAQASGTAQRPPQPFISLPDASPR